MNNSYDHNVANEKKWSRRAVTFDNNKYEFFRILQRELIVSIKLNSPSSFLDLGCGTGWAVRHVAALLKGRGRFVGIDISKGMIEKAKSDSVGIPDVEFYEANADKLPFENDAFDNVICTNSFHHYIQPLEVLKEIRRVLKTKGKIYILDVTADDFFIIWINKMVKAREREHVNFYSTAEFAHMFDQAGLKHIQSRRFKIYYPLKVHVGGKDH